ncbi:MAG: T9SS type A sorting domain-containing protein [Bacteroidia bacterium]
MRNNYKLKTQLGLFLSCFMMMYSFGLKAQTVTLNAVLSGKVTSGDVLTNGDETNICSTCDRGYLKFDLSSIPGGATITSATLSLVAIAPSTSSGSPANKITSTTLDAATAGAGFYAAIGSAPSAFTGSWAFGSLPNTFNMTINASGITNLNTALGTGQITYGVVRGSVNVYTFGGYNNVTTTNQPQLTITYGFPCSGTPTAGTASGPSSVCSGINFNLNIASSGLTGLTYQWQSSPDGIAPYVDIAGATGTTATVSQTASTFYQCVVTCTASGLSAISNAVSVTMNAAAYASIPYTETFEASWSNGCGTKDIPDNNWRNSPVTGNNSWRRQDEGATAAWSFLPSGIVTPSGSTGAADYHSYGSNAGSGTMDLYLDLSTTSPLTLKFNYDNATGMDSMQVFLSTDGGATFGPALGTYYTAAWDLEIVDLGVVNSATSVLRFIATTDYGNDDIGIDNVNVDLTPACNQPTALTITSIGTDSAVVGWSCPTCPGPFIIESGLAGFTPGTGTINTAASAPFTLTGLTQGTGYQVYISQNCTAGVGGISAQTGPTGFTTRVQYDDVCGAFALAMGANGPFNTVLGTVQAGEPSPAGTDCTVDWCNNTLTNSLWFSFIAPASGRVSVQSPGFDTQLALWDAANCDTILHGGATLLAANDDDTSYVADGGAHYSSMIRVSCLTPGKKYFVQLDPYSSPGDTTSIMLADLGPANASFTGLTSPYCAGDSAAVTLVPAQAGGVFIGAGITGNMFSPAMAGTGSHIIIYKESACDSTMQTVVVDSLPNAAFTAGVSAATGTFTNMSTNNLTNSWDFGDGSPVNTTANPSHLYTANGTYNVELIVSNTCGMDTTTQTVTIVGIGIQENVLGGITVFPNPTNGMLSVTMNHANFSELKISVVDIQGKEVYTMYDKNITTNYSRQINLENLSKGLYYIKLSTGTDLKVQKLIIQ